MQGKSDVRRFLEQELAKPPAGAIHTTSRSTFLKDRQVAFSGRMASMSRHEAGTLVRHHGGEVVDSPSTNTDLLVVGQEGAILAENGTLDPKLERAKRLEDSGAPIRVVTEEDFLSSIGCEDSQRLYTVAQLSRILKVPGRQIRAWVRAGLIEPRQVVHRLPYFDYAQVAGAKTLSELTRAGVSVQQIRRTLEQVRLWLPHAQQALTQLQLFEEAGGELLVRLQDGRLVEPSGQLQLDFERPVDSTDDGASSPTRVAPQPAPSPAPTQPRHMARILPSVRPPVSSEEWFEKGNQLEDSGQFHNAEEAYRNALDLGGPSAEVYFNLGNVLYSQGEKVDAVQALLQAVQLDSQYVEAWNNLGNILVELGRQAEAIEAYQVAVQVAPRYADAHYNLAETLAQSGHRHEAESHWRAYLMEDPRSLWSEQVRARLSGV